MNDSGRYEAPSVSKKAVASSAGLLTALNFGQRFIELGFTAVLARLLTPSDFGVIAAATIFINLAQLLVELGIAATIVQLKQLDRRDIRVANTVVGINALLYCLITLAAAPVAGGLMNVPGLVDVLRVLALVFLLQAPGIVAESLLVRNLEALKVARIQLFTRIFAYGGVGIGLAWLDFGYWALVGATLASTAAKSVVLVATVRPPMMPLMERERAKRLMRRGTGFSISRVINFAALRGDNFLVGYFMNAAALGLYSRAWNLMNLPADLYGKIAERLIFPSFAAMQDDAVRFRRAFAFGLHLTAAMGIPISIMLYIIAPELVDFILGDQWHGVIAPFMWLAIATYFRLGMKIVGSVQRAKGATRAMISTQILYAAAVVGGCLLTYQYGLVALSAAVSLGVVICWAAMSWSGCHLANFSFADFLAGHRSGILLGLGTAAVVWPTVYFCRAAELGSFLTLAATGTVSGVVALIVFAALPRWLFSSELITLIQPVRETIFAKLARTRMKIMQNR